MYPDEKLAVSRNSANGELRHGNPSGDPSSSPRCGAKTRAGKPCQGPAMWSSATGRYTRCRLHGGKSTGPRTPEGLERSRKARWTHGQYSAEHLEWMRLLRKRARLLGLYLKTLVRDLKLLRKGRITLDQMECELATIRGAIEYAVVLGPSKNDSNSVLSPNRADGD